MKKILFLLLICLGVEGQNVIRVTNSQNLQEVVNSAPNGSILLVESGSYGDLQITKPITLFGPGYFLHGKNANEGVQATESSALLGQVIIRTTGNGTHLSGLKLNDYILKGENIIISSCHFNGITIEDSSKNISIQKSFFSFFDIGNSSTGINLKNNIINAVGRSWNSVISGRIRNRTYVEISSNSFIAGGYVFLEDYGTNNIAFRNNIFPNTAAGFWGNPNSTFKNNIYQHIDISPDNLHPTNKFISNYESLYLSGNQGAPDYRYQLAPNSPARGAGENGTDCGAYGGVDPYVLSGVPNIPSIYYLNVQPSVPQGGTLQVEIKAKTNN